MIGSNSSALRQHAYSVFTASRRQPRSPSDDVPESVLRPVSPSRERVQERASEGLAEPKGVTPAPLGGVMSALKPQKPVPQKPVETPASIASLEPTQDEIRRRAHEIYLSRGGQPGDPQADWLRAEAELRLERGLT